MSWCGKGPQPLKGKEVLEGFNKIAKADTKEFTLKSNRYMKIDTAMLDRMNASQVKLRAPPPKSTTDYRKFLQGQLSEYVKKKILKSNYQELIEKYKGKTQKWTDPDFKPQQSSWGTSQKNVVWKRAGQIIKNPKFVQNNFSAADILQGRLGNCYFLSAIAGLAERPYRIKRLFTNFQINPNGIYMARIMFRGVYQEVVVDDYFPCNNKGELLGAQPAGGRELWVMVLEKCWAKMFKSYDAIDGKYFFYSGGLPNEVLHAFSAAPTYNYRIPQTADQEQLLWAKMLKAYNDDQVICCGTIGDDLQDLGLVSGHAYSILAIFDSPYRILRIRNPWGSMEWKGLASDNDKRFWSKISSQQQLKMGQKVGDDGVFFMLWQDFLKYFIVIDICRIYDNAQYIYEQYNFKPSQPIFFDVTSDGGQAFFSISQASRRQLKVKTNSQKAKLATTTLILAKKINNDTDYEYVMSKQDNSYSDFNLKIRNLPQGDYLLMCFAEGEERKTVATVSVYSEANVYITQCLTNRQDALHKTYLSHARKNEAQRQYLSSNPPQWACFDVLTDNCGFGYSVFHLDSKSSRKLGLQFDQSEYKANGLQLMDQFKGAGSFKTVCQIGKQTIVLCRLVPGKYVSEFMMPTPKMFRLK